MLISFDGKASAFVVPKKRAKRCDANMTLVEKEALKAAKKAEDLAKKAAKLAKKAAGTRKKQKPGGVDVPMSDNVG